MSEYHVASFVGRAHPKHFAEIRDNICAIKGCEIHGKDQNGKFIVSMESSNDKDIADNFILLQQLPNLIDLSLVYHEYIDEESEPVARE